MNLYRINKVLSDNYKNHQMIKEAFPGNGKVLWKKRSNHLLVLTNCQLNNELQNSDVIVDMGSFESNLSRNLSDKMLFSIRLNACKAKKRKRFSVQPDEVETWVRQKLTGFGFDINHMKVIHEGCLTSIRKNQKNTHSSVLVEGVFQVHDKELLIRALTSGVGHAKAYGFGLLDVFCF